MSVSSTCLTLESLRDSKWSIFDGFVSNETFDFRLDIGEIPHMINWSHFIFNAPTFIGFGLKLNLVEISKSSNVPNSIGFGLNLMIH